MARVISVFLPLWPTDRLRRQAGDAAPSAEAPLVLAGRVGNRRLVTAACVLAQELGLSAGMPVGKVQALVPGLQVLPHDPAADAASLERLALWVLQRFSPIVAVDPPDGIVIDSTGADHLHGGEAAMLEALIGQLAMSGVTARAAIADTWGAAHTLARYRAEPVFWAEPGTADTLLPPCPSPRCACHPRPWLDCEPWASSASAIFWDNRARHWPGASARTCAAAWTRRLAMPRNP